VFAFERRFEVVLCLDGVIGWFILGGIIRIIFGLRTRWTPNVGNQGPKALIPDMRKEESEGESDGYNMIDTEAEPSRAREGCNKCLILPLGVTPLLSL
jgi:hypothetical protein